MTIPILTLTGISKRFGSVQVLSEVDLEVRAGEVVALVGANGAGKSTLVKVIAGVDPADSGEICWQGNHVSISRPHDATALGIATVYQDLSLCDNLDVVANLFLGNEAVRLGVLDEIAMECRAWELLSSLSVTLPSLRVPVSALSGGQRQSVAIARAMLGSPKLVILDEPTAALGIAQTAQVLTLIERLRDQGLGVILISHNLTNVKAVADWVVVLRLGHNAGDFDIGTATEQDIVAAITGASRAAPPRRPSTASGAISITEAGR
ncbi:MAG: sugar ABC transporter ATP-binding protein [Pseudonocardiales bacterium]|nr:sugar ABC transporter ATP-binding protein [Pseudonocardiales bacterium]